jgi:hypothetical protein
MVSISNGPYDSVTEKCPMPIEFYRRTIIPGNIRNKIPSIVSLPNLLFDGGRLSRIRHGDDHILASYTGPSHDETLMPPIHASNFHHTNLRFILPHLI